MNIVSFSGGKDSTALVYTMMEHKVPIDLLIYFDGVGSGIRTLFGSKI